MTDVRIIKRGDKYVIQHIDVVRCRWIDYSIFDTFYDAMVRIQYEQIAGHINYDYYDKHGQRVYTKDKAAFALGYRCSDKKFILISYLCHTIGTPFLYTYYDDAMSVIRMQCVRSEYEGEMIDD